MTVQPEKRNNVRAQQQEAVSDWLKKIAFLCQFVGQLLAIMYCESILAAILDCEVPTNGILCDFYYVILYNISDIF